MSQIIVKCIFSTELWCCLKQRQYNQRTNISVSISITGIINLLSLIYTMQFVIIMTLCM